MKTPPALLTVLAATLLLLVAACESTPLSGYRGDQPTPVAQSALREARGESFTDTFGVLGGGSWTIGTYAVRASDAFESGEGPTVEITQGDTSMLVPVTADGDLADLIERATGRAPDLSDETSAVYDAFWD